MLTPIFEQSYIADEAMRYKEALRKDELRKRVLEVQEREAWASTDLYERPLKKIERVKKFSLLEVLRQFLP